MEKDELSILQRIDFDDKAHESKSLGLPPMSSEEKLEPIGWFERYLNWPPAAGCLVIGIIIGHIVR